MNSSETSSNLGQPKAKPAPKVNDERVKAIVSEEFEKLGPDLFKRIIDEKLATLKLSKVVAPLEVTLIS